MKKLMSLLTALLLAAMLTVTAFAATSSPSQGGEDPVRPTDSTAPTSPQTGEWEAGWVIAGIVGMAAGTCAVVKKGTKPTKL